MSEEEWPTDHQYALEVQEPWGRMILDQAKKIETRAYPLPANLINQRILLLQSPKGTKSSQLGNEVHLNNSANVKIIGWCIFDQVKIYSNRIDFEKEEHSHCVAQSSDFAWKESTREIYGWRVASVGPISLEERNNYTRCVRAMRSIFKVFPR